ncbi:MAG: bifunctional glutamate N-acetyltransferase/amino-acid acetyltransferase ArgJ [Acidobacteriales bacterium]|nr:bifunctional glutamate N-acetyltransferase/amino-acid acetyltransferase ArgJ [Candidatus Koribacter versatilis]MBI3645289.1 bifunctional glutamate N-acetyltransferase/amino-acid acetyltransferase ArgJ [Terriglobales bacterium]
MTRLRRSPERIRLPRGFSFSALAAGIKASGRPDLALVEASVGAAAAALFTSNRVVAAPLEVDRASLLASGGRVRAVVVNSGNANCATGPKGRKACERICREAAKLLGVRAEEVFPSSTGIIGVPLPAQKIIKKLPELIAGKMPSQRGALAFARAIMTTDSRPKLASARFRAGSKQVTLLGIAKGSGMIHPKLATMLVYLFTDVSASPRELQQLLQDACDPTLNSMSVDGDTSTNDTVLLLASGQSGARIRDRRVRKKFAHALLAVCQSLAEQIVSDGEGVEHVIRLFVEQARSREEGLQVARAIAHSALVKTAWAGADPNWGRILAAVGSSGVPIDPTGVKIFIGNQMVCRHGTACSFDQERAHRALAQPVCDIRLQLRRGASAVRFLTTDLTAEYVRINADYST